MDRYVEVPGGRLFVTWEGDGPPIVLIHAAVADLRSWDAMVPGLVSAGFRVVRYDYRAFGRSTTDDVEFSFRADLVAVLDALGIDRAALVGNSRGGAIAFDTALEFPDRVVAAVGVGASLGGFEGTPKAWELPLFERADAVMGAATPDLDAIADLAVSLWVDGPGQLPDRVEPSVRAAVRTMCRPLGEKGRVRGRPIPLDPPADARIDDLRCPVLAVAGELDVSVMAQTARHIEAAAPNARAVVWPDVAHMIGMEVPDRLDDLIVDFLAPLRPW
jgi:3-oxoadipate enol-lactonase